MSGLAPWPARVHPMHIVCPCNNPGIPGPCPYLQPEPNANTRQAMMASNFGRPTAVLSPAALRRVLGERS